MTDKNIAELAKELRKPLVIQQEFYPKPFSTPLKDQQNPGEPEFVSVPLLVVPDGYTVHDLKPHLDQFRDKPERRKGHVKLLTAQSFIDFVNRNKGADTVLFASNGTITGKVQAVFDYDPAGADQSAAGWQDNEASYDFPTSEAFKAWAGKSGKAMSQRDFALFVNDRIADLGEATAENPVNFDMGILKPAFADPATVLERTEGLEVNAKKKYSQHQKLASGEYRIEFAEENTEIKNSAGKKVDVPNFFLLNISVFEEGKKILIPVRLRFAVDSANGIVWTFDVWDVQQVFTKTFREEILAIKTKTTLPHFFGNP